MGFPVQFHGVGVTAAIGAKHNNIGRFGLTHSPDVNQTPPTTDVFVRKFAHATGHTRPLLNRQQAVRFASVLVAPLPAATTSPAAMHTWDYGANVVGNKVHFKLWAPEAQSVEIGKFSPDDGKTIEQIDRLETDHHGHFFKATADFKEGELYAYRLKKKDGSVSKWLPDPRSRFQPFDVHGPSMVVNPHRFQWTDQNWKTPADLRTLVPYRLHVGIFTQKGDFDSMMDKFFNELLKNGPQYNAVELMPVGEFAGRRNWGYDQVYPFATENSYGHPDKLRKFINECHRRGIAVIADVIYNHLGPVGNYIGEFDRNMVRPSSTNWGDGFNYDHPQARRYVTDNIKFWINEMHLDGFRKDMTKFIGSHKSGPPREDIIQELTQTAWNTKATRPGNNPHLYMSAEDGRNHNSVTIPHTWKSNHVDIKDADGHIRPGLGFNRQWNFDFHHTAQKVITGDSPHLGHADAYTMADVIDRGFRWPDNNYMRDLTQAVNFTQGHDEIGNHCGKRIVEKVGLQKARLAGALKFVIPGTPLTFNGEEYGETRRFNKFYDHGDEVVNQALDQEWRSNHSPQPQWTTEKAFLDSKLSWQKDPGMVQMNKRLVEMRHTIPAFWQGGRPEMHMDRSLLYKGIIVLQRWGRENPESHIQTFINVSPENHYIDVGFPAGRWQEIFNTESKEFGGSGLGNTGHTYQMGRHHIMIPGNSIVIFENKSRATLN